MDDRDSIDHASGMVPFNEEEFVPLELVADTFTSDCDVFEI